MDFGIDVVIMIVFGVWILYDRYKFRQKTKARVAQLEQTFVTQIAALEKVYSAAISTVDLQMDEIKWEQALLSACAVDVKHIESQFRGEMSMDKFNFELTEAAFYFFKSWRGHKALRPAVARIINLLQLFVANNGQEQVHTNSKQFN